MPPNLSPWREMAKRLAQSLRKQLAQTESEIASFLRPRPQPVPVPLPRQHRQARFPGDRRYYTQSLRARPKSSASIFVQTQFTRCATRPRLDGTLRRHGYRSFSTTPVNHAQIAREVYQSISQGIRAGVLNTPFFPPPTGNKQTGHVLAGLQASEQTSTTLTIPLLPAMSSAKNGTLTGKMVVEIDDILCSMPQYLARLRRDLSKLVQTGSFEYSLDASSLALHFHGKSQEQVEFYLRDIGVSSGYLSESTGLITNHRDADIDWYKTFAQPKLSSSIHEYIHAIDDRLLC